MHFWPALSLHLWTDGDGYPCSLLFETSTPLCNLCVVAIDRLPGFELLVGILEQNTMICDHKSSLSTLRSGVCVCNHTKIVSCKCKSEDYKLRTCCKVPSYSRYLDLH